MNADNLSPYVGGFNDEPSTEEQPTVHIQLDYDTAYNVMLDGLMNEASIEPMTEETFAYNATNLLHLLIDASEDSRNSDNPSLPTYKEIDTEAQRLYYKGANKGAVNGRRQWLDVSEEIRVRYRDNAFRSLTNPDNSAHPPVWYDQEMICTTSLNNPNL